MQPFLFEQAVAAITMRDKRYAPHAYYFLKDALDFTLKRVTEASGGAPRHVSGPELLDGFRDLALQEFGPMAATLMAEWGVRQCPDVGEMVFNLIDEQVFGRQESDCREDFKGAWDLEDALRLPYLPTRKLVERLRPGKATPRATKR